MYEFNNEWNRPKRMPSPKTENEIDERSRTLAMLRDWRTVTICSDETPEEESEYTALSPEAGEAIKSSQST